MSQRLQNDPSLVSLTVLALILLGIYLLIAIFAPLIALRLALIPIASRAMVISLSHSYGRVLEQPTARSPFLVSAIHRKQSWTHLLGTTEGQYDIFYGVVWGTRTAFFSSLAVVFMTFVIGVFVGAVAGYFGGMVDEVLMRITDIFMTLPFLFAAMILAAVLTPLLGRSLLPSMLALTTFGWMGYARMIRGEVSLNKGEVLYPVRPCHGSRSCAHPFQTNITERDLSHACVCNIEYRRGDVELCGLVFFGHRYPTRFADWGSCLGLGAIGS